MNPEEELLGDLYKTPFSHPLCDASAFCIVHCKDGSPPANATRFSRDDLRAGDPVWERAELQPSSSTSLITYAGRFLRFDVRNLTLKTFYIDDAGSALKVAIPIQSAVVVSACSREARQHLQSTPPSERSALTQGKVEDVNALAAVVTTVMRERDLAPAAAAVVPPLGTIATTGQVADELQTAGGERAILVTLSSLLQADAVLGGMPRTAAAPADRGPR